MSNSNTNRIARRFDALKAEGRSAFVTFITAGDPAPGVSQNLLERLPAAGADIIELGMPFSDPSADGPAIEKASMRAIKAGASVRSTFQMVEQFRKQDDDTPIVMMGYFNPVLAYGIERFVADAKESGVDGFIIVDLPPEEDEELRLPLAEAGLSLVRLATPTSASKRLDVILDGASGFVYYVAVAGVTGQKSAEAGDIGAAVARIKAKTDLPVAVGFGIKTAQNACDVAAVADGAVVGSAIVSMIEAAADDENISDAALVDTVTDFVRELADGVAAASS